MVSRQGIYDPPIGVKLELKSLGKRLRALREQAKLSQEALAAAAGLTAKYISELENGHANPSYLVLQAIARRGLRVPLGSLDAAEPEHVAEILTLLGEQPKRVRQRALRVLRALIEPARE